MTDNKQKVREALDKPCNPLNMTIEHYKFWSEQIDKEVPLTHEDWLNLQSIFKRNIPKLEKFNETLIDRDAVVSMLEGMKHSHDGLGKYYTVGHNTALDEAIKKLEEM